MSFPALIPPRTPLVLACLALACLAALPSGSALSQDRNPYPRRFPIPDFPRDLEWINVKTPLTKEQLKGKFVLLDFWTYCCINCIHTLPELKKLEKAYPNELVVIGVHSAKFETEKDAKNITEAVLRYEIEHPVINDADHEVWNLYGIQSWPTVLLIDPEGFAVWGKPGEAKFAEVEEKIKQGLAYYRKAKLLDEKPLKFDLAAASQPKTPLRFPGKVLADDESNRLFIADSNHNRIVVADLDGKLQDVIGSGQIGKANGDYTKASFNKPQGMALKGDTLYVADTENHMLRKVDLKKKIVSTIAGTGEQTRNPWPGAEGGGAVGRRFVGKPSGTALGSPWDLWVHEKDLYIAMAGPHQIWKMKLDETEIGPYAGNGREDIVDGPLLPRIPYQEGFASFAQPSGLASDGEFLYVADSEGSSIRRVPLDPKKEVETVVGTAGLRGNRLFTFGDRDGDRGMALLQHALGVVHVDGNLYITDTYNSKVKNVNAKTGAVVTLADGFDEPAGISYARGKLFVADTNHHLIRKVDPKSGKVDTLEIAGLVPPGPAKAARKPDFSRAKQVKVPPITVKPTDGKVKFAVDIKLPKGWKVNELAPASYYPEAAAESGPIDREAVGKVVKLPEPAVAFEFTLPAKENGADVVKISMNYYYCQEADDGVCKIDAVTWTIPLTISSDATADSVKLRHTATE